MRIPAHIRKLASLIPGGVDFSEGPVKANGQKVHGYFDTEEEKIEVDIRVPDWELVFYHEFAHWIQSIRDPFDETGYNEAMSDLFAYVNRDFEIDEPRVAECLQIAKSVELEAEKIGHGLAERFGAPEKTLEMNLKRARAYQAYWDVAAIFREWPRSSGADDKRVLDNLEPVLFPVERKDEKAIALLSRYKMGRKR